MPGRDGTGPIGAGAATGRGLGQCVSSGLGLGLGLGLGRGQRFGRGCINNSSRTMTAVTKQQLLSHKSYLQSRINQIDKTLENM
ncbi:MAG: DUF5320 domain-containing protein [Eubacteriales bacterium]